jgi:hypothetical protein
MPIVIAQWAKRQPLLLGVAKVKAYLACDLCEDTGLSPTYSLPTFLARVWYAGYADFMLLGKA